MPRERPILFSGPMVRALLAGMKTQTRRVVHPRLYIEMNDGNPDAPTGHVEQSDPDFAEAAMKYARCPYGSPGDRLWVRETWCLAHPDYHSEAEGEKLGRPMRDGRWCHYAATDDVESGDKENASPWKPSIHMPRWASRITLEVTEVRVQRLQDISEEDAGAEGVDPKAQGACGYGYAVTQTHLVAFARLWDSSNGNRAPWALNPWVWAISFKRIQS